MELVVLEGRGGGGGGSDPPSSPGPSDRQLARLKRYVPHDKKYQYLDFYLFFTITRG